MKTKIKVIGVLLLLYILTACNLNNNKKEITVKNTLLIFMNGSNLESNYNAASNDLQEMLKASKSEDLRIIVYTLGTKKWKLSNIKSNKNQVWEIDSKMILSKTTNKKSIAKASTLSEFLSYSINNFPSENYSLIFWGHGNGAVEGFGLDENFNNVKLSISEMGKALKDVKNKHNIKFNVIGFDACLMATIEVATTLAPYADYLVASQGLTPFHGWDYQYIIEKMSKNESYENKDIANIFVDSFYQQSSKLNTLSLLTISIIDLNKLNLLNDKLAVLANKIKSDIESNSNFYNLIKIRNNTEAYGNTGFESTSTDMIDFKHFIDNISYLYESESKDISNIFSSIVIRNINNSYNENANGMSIYFPYDKRASVGNYELLYEKLNFNDNYVKLVSTIISKYISLSKESLKISKVTYNEVNNNFNYQFKVNLEKEEFSKIKEYYFFLGVGNSNYYHYLYIDNNIDFNLNDNYYYLSYNYQNELLFLNDNYVYYEVMQKDESNILYKAPFLYYDENKYTNEVNLFIEYNDYINVGKIKKIEAISNNNRLFNNNILLKPYDYLRPVFFNNQGYIDYGSSIIYTEDFSISKKQLPSNAYVCGFLFKDYIGNVYKSEVITFNVK